MLLKFKTPMQESFAYPEWSENVTTIFSDPSKSLRIRNMSLAELLETRKNWLIPEGWPGMKYTLAATYANDKNGFYLLEKDGQKIACISVVTYPAIKFAYIGFYVVIKPMRSQGYGKLLINKAIQHATANLGIKSFALNCVESAVPMYQKYGFEVVTIDEFWKYTANSNPNKFNDDIVELEYLTQDLLSELIKFDAEILGAERKDFLQEFLFKPNTITVISQIDGKINGYGVISEREPAIEEPNKSYRVGPLYASNSDLAEAILKQLITIAGANESVFLETPGNNQLAIALVKKLGFEKTGQQPKLFKGVVPNFDIERMFCYNSVAVGG